jgi:hypothetical protein
MPTGCIPRPIGKGKGKGKGRGKGGKGKGSKMSKSKGKGKGKGKGTNKWQMGKSKGKGKGTRKWQMYKGKGKGRSLETRLWFNYGDNYIEDGELEFCPEPTPAPRHILKRSSKRGSVIPQKYQAQSIRPQQPAYPIQPNRPMSLLSKPVFKRSPGKSSKSSKGSVRDQFKMRMQ